MIRAFLMFLPLLSACVATPVPTEGPFDSFPATLGAGLAVMQSARVCQAVQRAPEGEEFSAGRLAICVPDYPRRLQEAGFIASCLVRFTVSPSGEPVTPEAVCDTLNDMGHRDDAKLKVANAMFVLQAERAIGQTRFRAGAVSEGKPIIQPIGFVYEGMATPRPPALPEHWQ
jgi:hypothetical protein